jgi:hypothetical protein
MYDLMARLTGEQAWQPCQWPQRQTHNWSSRSPICSPGLQPPPLRCS